MILLVGLAGALLVLNLLDGVLTWLGLELDAVTEANPLLRWAWSVSPVGVAIFKLIGVSVFVLLLVAGRRLRWPVFAARFLLVAYLLVFSLHLRWLMALYLVDTNFFQP